MACASPSAAPSTGQEACATKTSRFLVYAAFATLAIAQPREHLADYALVLEDQPVAREVESRAALQSSRARAHLARIRSAQSGILAELQSRKVPVTGAEQVLVNAILVSATPEKAAELRGLPGVRYVTAVPKLKPNLDRAAELQNFSTAWAAVGGAGNAGAGIKIGIIDSGIDHAHPGFQDPGLSPPAGFPKGETAYTNNKVIVARSYVPIVAKGFGANPANPAVTSRPDDYSPRDRIGHGTALAMIAAGVRNTGPVGTIQGVAPKAFLGNYKIFGSPGLNDASIFAAFNQALLDAIADGMDIVTLAMSEGDPALFGPLDVDPDPNFCGGPCDVFSQAVESAIRSGLTVVVSAGNSGNLGTRPETLSSVHFPGTAPSAITVGAALNSHVFYQTLRAGGNAIRGLFTDGPHIAMPLSAPIRDAGLACAALPANSLAGAVALIQRGTCAVFDKVTNAHNAGAVAAVIYQESPQDAISSRHFLQSTGIPSMMIGNADGVSLKAYIAANANASAALDPAVTAFEEPAFDTVLPSSSRGPSPGSFGGTPTGVIKPELVAVGANVYTATQKLDPNADTYHPSGYTSVTGTSYAVGMVAGTAALVKQKFSGMSPAQLKSAVVNTASPLGRANSAGAGRLNSGAAVNIAATLDPATISFGAVTSTTVDITRTVRVTNVGAQATFNLSVTPRDPDTSLNAQVTPSSITLATGQFENVSVSLRGNRGAVGSYEGVVTVATAGSSSSLRLPYQYIVPSGVPADIFPLRNGGFVGGVDDRGWLIALRVVDEFGIPVVGTPVRFNSVSGGGTITVGDAQSFKLGIAGARVSLGSTSGAKIFNATAGGMTLQFNGFARNYPDFAAARVNNAAANGQGLAPGSYIAIYGTDLADATQVNSTTSLPVALSNVSVSFDGDGISQPGRIHFVSPGQVNVQVPWEFQGKSSVAVKVTVGGLQGYDRTVPLVSYAPGVFAVVNANGSVVDSAHPASRGGTIVIFANGLGPVSNQPPSGEPSPSSPLAFTTASPTVTIGGVPTRVDFSGLTPGFVGLYQINAVVPADAPRGAQEMVVSIGGASSKPSVLTVE